MAYPESDAASSANYGPRSLAGSSQNQSTRELITPNGSPPRAPPPTPRLANISRFPVYRDSISIARARVTPSPHGFYRLTSQGSPPSPWPFRNATPRASMGSIDVSAMSSYPPSMMARSVSDMSEMDETVRPITPLGPLDPVATPTSEAQKSVTIDPRLPTHRSRDASLIINRPPTPLPSVTNNQASSINRGPSQMSRGTTRLSQIPRMPTPDLASARTEFFNQPVAADSAVNMATNRVPVGYIFNRNLLHHGSLAAYRDEGFDHPLALCVSGVVFVVFASGFAVTTASIANMIARGGQPGSLVIGWAFFNAILVVATGVWIFAVARRFNKQGKALREAAAHRAQQAGEGGALESQIELANMDQQQQQRPQHQEEVAPAAGSDSDDGDHVVRVLPPNGGHQFVRSGTPEPRAPPPTPERGVHAAAHQGGFLGFPAADEGISPSPSEASILSQLCEGVIAGGPPAATTAAATAAEAAPAAAPAAAAVCPVAGEKEDVSPR